jgi:acyl carrier protein
MPAQVRLRCSLSEPNAEYALCYKTIVYALIIILFYGGIIMIFNAIAELIAKRNDIDVSEITMESSFTDLGIDSLDTVEMLMNLEDKIGKEIELNQKVETVGELVRYIEAKL